MDLGPLRMEGFAATVRRAREWVDSNVERILEEPDLQAHYKGPYFWAAVGDARMAGIHRRVFAERFLRADGDFRSEETSKGFWGFPCTAANQYAYSNGWICAGMQRLGAYDIAARGLAFLEGCQDPVQGGLWSTFNPERGEIDRSLMDSSSTCSAGMAFLAAGRLERARSAGEFVLALLALQPEPERYFFSCMRADGSLHTDVFGSEDAWDPSGRKQKCLAADRDGSRELTWLIGKPTKFLTRLHTATGDRRYLDAALRCVAFFHGLDEGAWINYASCKTMWAAAELYRITGDEGHAETALRLLDHYAETQTESGTWVHDLWYEDLSQQTFAWSADITFEYGGEISDVISELAGR